jgi:hypothetical protein
VLPPVRPEPTEAPTADATPEAAQAPAEAAVPAVEGGAAESDVWKQEYEAQVEAWRVQSAEAREKSEKERARWEAIRAEEAAARKAAGIVDTPADIPTGLPDVYGHPVASTSTSSPGNIVRALVFSIPIAILKSFSSFRLHQRLSTPSQNPGKGRRTG